MHGDQRAAFRVSQIPLFKNTPVFSPRPVASRMKTRFLIAALKPAEVYPLPPNTCVLFSPLSFRPCLWAYFLPTPRVPFLSLPMQPTFPFLKLLGCRAVEPLVCLTLGPRPSSEGRLWKPRVGRVNWFILLTVPPSPSVETGPNRQLQCLDLEHTEGRCGGSPQLCVGVGLCGRFISL